MKALITGASSGIGMEMAKILAREKCELILVARSKEKLEYLQRTLPTKSTIIVMDLANEQKVKELYVLTRSEKIDILINNAGFGAWGEFETVPIGKEFEMIDTNIKAVHLLTKSFLRDMIDRDSGYILNVASSAGLMPGGPLMATYYATKSYITSLTNSIWYELKRKKSNVSISCLCPGPVATHFNDVAGVNFSAKPMKAEDVAEYAIDKMFERKRLIVPGTKMKMAHFFSRFLSEKALLRAAYKIQNKKRKK